MESLYITYIFFESINNISRFRKLDTSYFTKRLND